MISATERGVADERRQCQVGWGCVRKDVADKPLGSAWRRGGVVPGAQRRAGLGGGGPSA